MCKLNQCWLEPANQFYFFVIFYLGEDINCLYTKVVLLALSPEAECSCELTFPEYCCM